MPLDHTHDPDLISWVESARDHPDFPVQNLPFGVVDFGEGPRPVVAIGNEAFDLKSPSAKRFLISKWPRNEDCWVRVENWPALSHHQV